MYKKSLLMLFWEIYKKKLEIEKVVGKKTVKETDFLNSRLENFVHIVFCIT